MTVRGDAVFDSAPTSWRWRRDEMAIVVKAASVGSRAFPVEASIAARGNNFDGLRLLAALTVMFSHQYVARGDGDQHVYHLFSAGALAVAVFFAISGYLVSKSWHSDPDLFRFAARRLLRIWPALAVLVCVSAIGIGAYGGDGWFYLRNLAFDFVDPDVFNDGRRYLQLNGSLWTIPVEVGCYTVLGLAATVTGRAFRWFGVASVVAVLAWAWWADSGLQLYVFWGSFFLAGALIERFALKTQALVLGILLGVLCHVLGLWKLAAWLVVPCAAIIVGTASWPGLRQAGRFGDFSYGLYLWGLPAQQMVLGFFGYDSIAKLLACSVVLAGCAAFASWHLIEAPALRMKPRSARTA